MKQLHHWLYRVQQRLAITRREAAAILALLGLLLVGIVVRWIPRRPPPTPTNKRAARAFAAGTESLRSDTAKHARSPSRAATVQAVPININAAGRSLLERLPGIGPVLAGRIIAYRKAQGPFESEAELERVSGIGPKTMERLKPLIRVEQVHESGTDTANTGVL